MKTEKNNQNNKKYFYNYTYIPVNRKTKDEIEKIKKELNCSYDDVCKIFVMLYKDNEIKEKFFKGYFDSIMGKINSENEIK